jgi:hypothetical protein
MLVPITREKFQQIIPVVATGPQYAYYWGKWSALLKRLLISVVAVVIILLVLQFFGEAAEPLKLMLVVIGGLYWLWSPVYWASTRNASYRRFPYSGFWRGRILDVYITEDLINEEETFNQKGELIILENRERRLNLLIGDRDGWKVEIQAPLRRSHKIIKPGEIAELLVLSHRPDLSKIEKITDAYLPSYNLWVGEYPWLRRDIFADVSRQLGGKGVQETKSVRRPKEIRRRVR